MPEKGATSSCSFLSSVQVASSNRSWRVESACPNFTKMGPKASRASRAETAAETLGLGSSHKGASSTRSHTGSRLRGSARSSR